MANQEKGSKGTDAPGNGGSSRSRLSSHRSRRQAQAVSWGDGSPNELQRVVDLVTAQGALISFSKTSDGGALALFIKDGQDVFKEYANSADALHELLDDLTATYSE